MTTAIRFSNDDEGYLRWIGRHPQGYVVNIREIFDKNYVVLHRANCHTVNSYRGMDKNPDGFTARGYRNICALELKDLERYLVTYTSRKPPFSKRCSRCT